MSFIHPQATHRDFHEINRQNLALLQEYDGKVQPLTNLALKCFNEIQESSLGTDHYFKKYTVTALAFLGTITVPVVGGGYALWQLVPRTPVGLFGGAFTAGCAIVANETAKTAFNFSPFKFIMTLLRTAVVHAAGKVSDATLGSYRAYEEVIHKRHTSLFEAMLTNLRETYDGMAQNLATRYEEAKSHPADMIALKNEASDIFSHLPHAREALLQVRLQEGTIHQITNALEERLKVINAFKLQLKIDDAAHNTALLLSAPIEAHVCIPQKALDFFEEANRHTLGLAHTVEKLAGTGLAAVCGFGAVYAGTSYSLTSKLLRVIPSLAATAVTGTIAFCLHAKKERQFINIAIECSHEAAVIVQNTYDEIATHLLAQLAIAKRPSSGCKKRKAQEAPLLDDARILKAKMAEIHRTLARYNIPQDVTQNLEKALDTIIENNGQVTTRKSDRLAKKRR